MIVVNVYIIISYYIVACPSTVAGVDCSGHGICEAKLTNITYEQEWDFLSTSECKCHDGYYGASCTECIYIIIIII